jgi:squalene-hopene/tetraprenyl-beta-curcumene cyclase
MTYALLKCLLLAGAPPEDPRVLAALGWLTRNFTVEKNPGFEGAKDPAKESMQGYFYYLFTMSKALALYESLAKKPLAVKDAQGRARDWRTEISERLASMQGQDGGWKNTVAERWEEGSRTLATTYAVLALAHATGRLP